MFSFFRLPTLSIFAISIFISSLTLANCGELDEQQKNARTLLIKTLQQDVEKLTQSEKARMDRIRNSFHESLQEALHDPAYARVPPSHEKELHEQKLKLLDREISILYKSMIAEGKEINASDQQIMYLLLGVKQSPTERLYIKEDIGKTSLLDASLVQKMNTWIDLSLNICPSTLELSPSERMARLRMAVPRAERKQMDDLMAEYQAQINSEIQILHQTPQLDPEALKGPLGRKLRNHYINLITEAIELKASHEQIMYLLTAQKIDHFKRLIMQDALKETLSAPEHQHLQWTINTLITHALKEDQKLPLDQSEITSLHFIDTQITLHNLKGNKAFKDHFESLAFSYINLAETCSSVINELSEISKPSLGGSALDDLIHRTIQAAKDMRAGKDNTELFVENDGPSTKPTLTDEWVDVAHKINEKNKASRTAGKPSHDSESDEKEDDDEERPYSENEIIMDAIEEIIQLEGQGNVYFSSLETFLKNNKGRIHYHPDQTISFTPMDMSIKAPQDKPTSSSRVPSRANSPLLRQVSDSGRSSPAPLPKLPSFEEARSAGKDLSAHRAQMSPSPLPDSGRGSPTLRRPQAHTDAVRHHRRTPSTSNLDFNLPTYDEVIQKRMGAIPPANDED